MPRARNRRDRGAARDQARDRCACRCDRSATWTPRADRLGRAGPAPGARRRPRSLEDLDEPPRPSTSWLRRGRHRGAGRLDEPAAVEESSTSRSRRASPSPRRRTRDRRGGRARGRARAEPTSSPRSSRGRGRGHCGRARGRDPRPTVETEPETDDSAGAGGDPEAHIAALMAKIRPQRGRLPIPEYEDVDHAAILQMPTRERGRSSATRRRTRCLDECPRRGAGRRGRGDRGRADDADRVLRHLVGHAVRRYHPEETPVETPVETLETTSFESRRRRDRACRGLVDVPAEASTRSSRASVPTCLVAQQRRAGPHLELHRGGGRLGTSRHRRRDPRRRDQRSAGLPVRRPGARLVPGSVTKPVGVAGRDPEAIRARLSAHKAGVRRGRTASVSADDQ